MWFRNYFTGEVTGAHPYSVLTLPSTAGALEFSFIWVWGARQRREKSQTDSRPVSGQDLDPGIDTDGVHQIPVDYLSGTILPQNSIPL